MDKTGKTALNFKKQAFACFIRTFLFPFKIALTNSVLFVDYAAICRHEPKEH
jgi:hypothetical protein